VEGVSAMESDLSLLSISQHITSVKAGDWTQHWTAVFSSSWLGHRLIFSPMTSNRTQTSSIRMLVPFCFLWNCSLEGRQMRVMGGSAWTLNYHDGLNSEYEQRLCVECNSLYMVRGSVYW